MNKIRENKPENRVETMTPEEWEKRLQEIRDEWNGLSATFDSSAFPFLLTELDRMTAERDEVTGERSVHRNAIRLAEQERDVALADVQRLREACERLLKFNEDLCADIGVSKHYPSADFARAALAPQPQGDEKEKKR